MPLVGVIVLVIALMLLTGIATAIQQRTIVSQERIPMLVVERRAPGDPDPLEAALHREIRYMGASEVGRAPRRSEHHVIVVQLPIPDNVHANNFRRFRQKPVRLIVGEGYFHRCALLSHIDVIVTKTRMGLTGGVRTTYKAA